MRATAAELTATPALEAHQQRASRHFQQRSINLNAKVVRRATEELDPKAETKRHNYLEKQEQ